jgi:hypothetical protein
MRGSPNPYYGLSRAGFPASVGATIGQVMYGRMGGIKPMATLGYSSF